jgi:LmbE family N-acetylglucosaminyl deacetylase
LFAGSVAEFQAPLLIIAPHMDDEALACGGVIAMLPCKERIHVVLATDGTKSPSPIIPWRDSVTPDLGEVRMGESRAALKVLGVPEQNVHFLRLPEARLGKHLPRLATMLTALVERIQPATILMPFRYDRHPDHLAVNHVVTAAQQQGKLPEANLFEYFVYYRWRLLPGRDLRRYIEPQYLLEIDIQDVSARKRMALDCFKTQTTIFYSWQTRPILTSDLLDEVSRNPELFLRYDPAVRGAAVFTKAAIWIRFTHRLEPFLKKWRYLLGASLQRALGKP